MLMKRLKLIIPIFIITFSTVLLEVLYTRIFSVIYMSSFAFLMVSLALFGYGLSGVYMSISKITKRDNAIKYLEIFLLLFALSLVVVYKITISTDIDFLKLFDPSSNFFLLILNFLLLLLPFFFGGCSLVLIFTLYSSEIGELYFVDLIGAASGGIAIIFLITFFGPSKTIFLAFLLLGIAWFFITRFKKAKRIIISMIIILAFIFFFFNSNKFFSVVPKMEKRAYLLHHYSNVIEHSEWSPINKIDVAPFLSKKKKIIWIDAGTMQSFLVRFKGNINNLKPIKYGHEAIPYLLTRKGSSFIIGSAGGYEVLCALSNDFKQIVAVEMDPVICDLVKEDYADYIGNIFDNKGVYLFNDEGRSVLKRLDRKFDIIQMVNSHNADTILSGGLSIAETYIYTVESFKDYWKHLHDDGFVSIVHWFGERLFSSAFQALREMNVENPEKKFFVIQARNGFNFFFMKKGNINEKEASILKDFSNRSRRKNIMFSPFIEKDNIYYKLASKDYRKIIKESSVNIAPVRDNSPYFNQPNKIGQFKFDNLYIKGMAKEVIPFALKYSNSVYLSILALSIIFPIFLIFIPLKITTKKITNRNLLLYFFLIGIAFIMVEIILIKIFQLYLGNPAYSISAIISSLLVSSGIGSLFSSKIRKLWKDKTVLYASIILFFCLLIYSLSLFQIFSFVIHLSLILRFLFTFLLIFIPGFFMGVFFPLGIGYLGKSNKQMIGWAWGANAFATVLGSVLTVIIAINWNFSIVLILASLFYLISGIIFYISTRTSTVKD